MKYTILFLLLTIYSCGIKAQVDNNKPLIKTTILVNKDNYKIGESIELTFEVKNNSKKSFTFLPWGTPLENRFTRKSLNIIHNNEVVEYSGIMVKRRPATEKDYKTLKTNETTTGKVNILKGYKLIGKGVYHIQFKESGKIPASNIITIEIK